MHTDSIRTVTLPTWHETATFNTNDIDDNEVLAQGSKSGKFYLLTFDDDGNVIDVDIYQ